MAHTVDYIVHKIREFRRVSGYAKFRLATMAGVPEGCTRDMDKKEWNPTLSTIRKLDEVVPDDFEPSEPKKPKRIK